MPRRGRSKKNKTKRVEFPVDNPSDFPLHLQDQKAAEPLWLWSSPESTSLEPIFNPSLSPQAEASSFSFRKSDFPSLLGKHYFSDSDSSDSDEQKFCRTPPSNSKNCAPDITSHPVNLFSMANVTGDFLATAIAQAPGDKQNALTAFIDGVTECPASVPANPANASGTRFGYMDRPVIIAASVGAKTPPPLLVLMNLNVSPITGAGSNDYKVAMTLIEMLAKHKSLNTGMKAAYTAGETLIAGLPPAMYMTRDDARDELMRVVKLEANDSPTDFNLPGTSHISTDIIAQTADVYVTSPGVAMGLVVIKAGNMSGNSTYTERWLSSYIAAFVALAKRGNISAGQLRKIQDGVGADQGCTIRLSALEISSIWKMWGSYITPQIAEECFTRWRAMISRDSLRLFLTISQAAGSGLTQYYICLEAMDLFGDFPWSTIIAMLPADWAALTAARGVIGQNKYYGFSNSLGIASSTKYRTLAYVCCKLLIDLGGKSTLKDYKGISRNIPNQGTIDNLIRTYVDRKSQPPASGANSAADLAEIATFVNDWRALSHVPGL